MSETISEWDLCIGTTMIGDVIGSRRYWLQHGPDGRRVLQQRLEEILNKGNHLFETIEPLRPSIGDEFQGAFSDWETALSAGLWLRLSLQIECDVDTRYGFGDGEFFYHPQAPLQQGDAWRESRSAVAHSRSWQRADPGDPRRSCFLSSKGRYDARALNRWLAENERLLTDVDVKGKRQLVELLEDGAVGNNYHEVSHFLRSQTELLTR